jgi:ABC-2 type transport system permease protein
MMYQELQAIYVLWLRQMRRILRAPSRIIGNIVQPLFLLLILGFGLGLAFFPGLTTNFTSFLAPGIIAMAILMSSIMTGVSVLWDRQFGFLQEVLIAPVSRFSIILGRTFGGATLALLQGFVILGISLLMGVTVSSPFGLALTILIMILLSFTAVGFGLIIASLIKDFEGFQVISNLILMPLFLLSTALFPIEQPTWLKTLTYFNPIFYMVDGIRGSLTGANNVFSPYIDLAVISGMCIVIWLLGNYLFNRSEA